jgi:hypothetical protein
MRWRYPVYPTASVLTPTPPGSDSPAENDNR